MEPIISGAEKPAPQDAPSDSKDATRPLPDLLKWLGDHRDGFLVTGAALYGLGYLVWSYNAWRTGRGLLPALELQYFVAGIVPALIIVVAWGAISFFYKIRDKLFRLTTNHPVWSKVITLVVGVGYLIYTGLAVAVHYRWLNLGWTYEEFGKRSTPILLVIFYLWLVAYGQRRRKSSATFRGPYSDLFLGLYRYLVALMFAYYGIVFYLELYPRLPQELGGPKPRCAYVDMVVKGVSKDTLDVLVAPKTPPAVSASSGEVVSTSTELEVVRSKPLQVFFSSNDYLLVRPRSDGDIDDPVQTRETPLYELRKDVIRVVTWCK